MKEMYKLKFGERMKFDIWDIWRVPGGWLFACDMKEQGGISQFVPWDNEFQVDDTPVVHPVSASEYARKDDPEEDPNLV